MGIRSLAEAVILQSLEDLWSPLHRRESREFFDGEVFKVYAGIAEVTVLNRYKTRNVTGRRKNGRAIREHRA